jgi:hypothetical protein
MKTIRIIIKDKETSRQLTLHVMRKDVTTDRIFRILYNYMTAEEHHDIAEGRAPLWHCLPCRSLPYDSEKAKDEYWV